MPNDSAHPLKIVAVTSSEEIRSPLYKQLQTLPFVEFSGVYMELSDAAYACQKHSPDVLIVDMTHREIDAALFIQTIGMDPESHCVIYALNKEMDFKLFKTVMQQGATEFIQYPEDMAGLELALRKHQNTLTRFNRNNPAQPASPDNLPVQHAGQLIACFSPKGGAGCSTVAANLAFELSTLHKAEDKAVVFLDLDQSFCNTLTLFNQKPSFSIGDIADSNLQDMDTDFLNRIVIRHDNGLSSVVGSKNILDDNEMIASALLERVVDQLVSLYRYVVIDLPTHALDLYHQYIVERADTLLVVSTPDLPSLHRTRQYLDLANRYLDISKIKMVLNRHDLKSAYKMQNRELEKEFNYQVFAYLPNDWELTVEAVSFGKMVREVNPRAELAKAYHKLANSLMLKAPAAVAQPKQTVTTVLLNKLFSGKQ
jgi:pilus assembly protein CpaE